MKLWDYHTHHERCKHATGNLEDYIRAAIDKNLSAIGLSDHYPMYMLPEESGVWNYSMAKEEFPTYLEEAKSLREKYAHKISVLIASEVDYYPDQFDNYMASLAPVLDNFDYLIGSVHIIRMEDGPIFGVDEKIIKDMVSRYSADKIYLRYYSYIEKLVRTNYFDIIGHLDLPKRWGIRPETPSSIREKVLTILDRVEQSGIAVEINMSGQYKFVKEQYPEDWIIRELVDRGIPITPGSDSHMPAMVGYHFDPMVETLKKYGLKNLCQFKKREKILIPLS